MMALITSRSQVINSFAKALEVIPRNVAQNAGFDSTDILNKLRQKHAAGASAPPHTTHQHTLHTHTGRHTHARNTQAPTHLFSSRVERHFATAASH